jgi:Lon-like ATP-dependent protease
MDGFELPLHWQNDTLRTALYVEPILETVLSTSSRPGLERTGSLKDVMKESAVAVVAYSFAKGLMTREFPGNRFFEKAKVHLHCPEGAVTKDGKYTPTVPTQFYHPVF